MNSKLGILKTRIETIRQDRLYHRSYLKPCCVPELLPHIQASKRVTSLLHIQQHRYSLQAEAQVQGFLTSHFQKNLTSLKPKKMRSKSMCIPAVATLSAGSRSEYMQGVETAILSSKEQYETRLHARHSIQPTPPKKGRTTKCNGPRQRSRRRTKPTIGNYNITVDVLVDANLVHSCHSVQAVSKYHGYWSEQNVQNILKKTRYSKSEVLFLWVRFKALCSLATTPRGLDKEMFRKGITFLSQQDQWFVNRVFFMLDADASGVIDFEEYAVAMSCLERGTPSDRLRFLFKAYDIDGNNSISRDELTQFFLESLLVESNVEIKQGADHFVGQIFSAMGSVDKDCITVESALEYMTENETTDIFALFGRSMVTGR